ncbi:487_t:CDS:2 [Funneliformis geosporum]|uniref:487_t:CDS:1 n=1 Tax=Funneliformis geosporum TaxID=1117311 RepID=A0A9W4X5G9_9GLOM|nr:487_t:CDS:2 [Funneliformis geosporum]
MGANHSKNTHRLRKESTGSDHSSNKKSLERKTSVSSNTEKYKYIEGRRFHNLPDIHYDLPNDDDEVDRLHLEHFLIRTVWKSNYSSPIDELLEAGCTVLDIGCGPGAWCLDMATKYKNSKFFGLDISPMFPKEIKPNNTIFQECQILDGIPYNDQSFDFCHMRFMFPSFDESQFENIVIREVSRVLKVGGYLEVCEYELCQNCGPILQRLLDLRCEMMTNIGRNPKIAALIGKFMEKTNLFDEVHFEERTIGIGSWAGRIGEVAKDDVVTRMYSIKPALMNHINGLGIGISSEDYDEMMRQSVDEFNEYQTYFVTCRWYGKKLK